MGTMNRLGRRLSVIAGILAVAAGARAVTYLPLSDGDLAAGAPVIVRASVLSRQSRLDRVGDSELPFTIVMLRRLETLKGAPAEDVLTLRLPGGRVGEKVWWIPGTPVFGEGQEVVVMLRAAPGTAGEYALTELGLSRFDLVDGGSGTRYALRPAFGAGEDLAAAARPAVRGLLPNDVPVREAESFLEALRAIGRGEPAGEIVWRAPGRELPRRPPGLDRKWVNIGGREPGDCGGTPCLFRWFWDTGVSPDAVVSVTGTQTNLSGDDAAGCGTDSHCDVEHGIDAWHGITGTDIRMSGISAAGNVVVALDATQSFDGGVSWSTPGGCGGTIGLGGPGAGTGPRNFRGDTTYYAPSSGNVSMRKMNCQGGYSARTFKTAVMHELGHVLSLGHPDEDESMHGTTSPDDWDVAVMRSSIADAQPETAQPDDLEAMRYLYGTAPIGTLPVANFAFSPAAPSAGAPVTFSDSSSGAPISWLWNFGDPASGSGNVSSSRNPSHVFSQPGTYFVKLTAAASNGSGIVTRQVQVAPATSACTPSATTLCLDNDRFSVRAAWRTGDGRTGDATGVKLTSDSGYFWFFSEANIEVVAKVLQACSVNQHHWVFAAGLTNVEVTLTVTDTAVGTVKVYTNPLNTAFAPIQDTAAFPCP